MTAARRLPSPAFTALRLAPILAVLAVTPVAGLASPSAAPAAGAFAVIDDAADPHLQFGLRLEAVLAELRDTCFPPFIYGRSADFELFLWQTPPARTPCAGSGLLLR